MKARVWHWAKPVQSDRCEPVQVWMELRLPFVPACGMRLKVVPAGHVLRVSDVYWDIASADVIEVFTAEPERLPALREMLTQGWRSGNEQEAG